MEQGREQGEEVGMVDARTKAGSFSRREFLRRAGVAGAVIGLGAGLGGAVAACGEEGATTTTAATTATTVAPSTTSTSGAASTTASSGPEAGREVKIGVITPVTGVLALFGVGDKWALELVKEYVGGTLILGDGKEHPLNWVQRDTQSNVNRVGQVTSDLILNDKVDLIVVAGGPDTVNPAADTAEALETPLLAVNSIWQAFIFGRGGTMNTKYKWTYAHLIGVDQMARCAAMTAGQVPTNKVVGLFIANTAAGNSQLLPNFGYPDVFKNAGFTVLPPDQYNMGTEDFTSLISSFKKAGCEVHAGAAVAGADFSNFWQQALQQGYHPKVCIENVGLSDYKSMVALGDACLGICVGHSWHKDWPFSDLISGMTNAQLADNWEEVHKELWNNMITPYARFGWAVDVLKRVKDPDDKESILEAITTTKTTLISGPIDFTAPVDLKGQRVHHNVYKQVHSMAQIVKGTKWQFDLPQCAIVDAPAGVEASYTAQPMQY